MHTFEAQPGPAVARYEWIDGKTLRVVGAQKNTSYRELRKALVEKIDSKTGDRRVEVELKNYDSKKMPGDYAQTTYEGILVTALRRELYAYEDDKVYMIEAEVRLVSGDEFEERLFDWRLRTQTGKPRSRN